MKKEYRKILIFGSLIWIISNFHHPITPTHFTNLNLPDHIFGTSQAAMMFGMFITSPIWGSLGDKYGRSNIIYISPILYSLGQIGLALSTSLPSILFFRFLSGSASGGFNVGIMGYIVDVNLKEDVGVAMGKYSAVIGISVAFGYLVGGFLGFIGAIPALIIQAVSMFTVGILMKLYLKPSKNIKPDKKITFVWDLFKDIKRTKEVFTPWIIVFLIITFFGAIGDNSNVNATNYYMKAQLNLQPIVNGAWKSVTGIVGLIANLTINIWLIRKTNIRKSILVILLFSTFSGFLMFFNNNFYIFLMLNLILVTLYTMQTPILLNFAIEGQEEHVGLMSGIYNAIKSLGAMSGSIITGFSYSYNSKYPFLIGAVAFLLALIFGSIHSIFNKDDKTVKSM